VAARQAQGPPVPAPVGDDRQPLQQALVVGVDERECVFLCVGVDTDHVGDVVCKHGAPSVWGNVVPVVTRRAAARLG
jgi:hypothetical protein